MDASTLTPDYIRSRVKINRQSKCWEWALSTNPQTGYGQVGFAPYTAHRLAYQLLVGDPTGLVIRHACHNRICCNPAHLRAGSQRDNYLDSLPAYQASWDRRRGEPARNAIPVTVRGVTYPSKVHAMKVLRIGDKALTRLMGQ